jgi:hypothetical protein
MEEFEANASSLQNNASNSSVSPQKDIPQLEWIKKENVDAFIAKLKS